MVIAPSDIHVSSTVEKFEQRLRVKATAEYHIVRLFSLADFAAGRNFSLLEELVRKEMHDHLHHQFYGELSRLFGELFHCAARTASTFEDYNRVRNLYDEITRQIGRR